MKTTKASEEFQVGKHNIGWLDSDITKYHGDTEVSEGKVLTSHTLPRDMTDVEIMDELKVEECSLGDILATLDAATDEMKDGRANIFYPKGTSRVVRARWHGDVWVVRGWCRDGYGWFLGSRVFSPATGAQSSDSEPLPSNLASLEARIKSLEEWRDRVQG